MGEEDGGVPGMSANNQRRGTRVDLEVEPPDWRGGISALRLCGAPGGGEDDWRLEVAHLDTSTRKPWNDVSPSLSS
jgi:hypothetical protein